MKLNRKKITFYLSLLSLVLGSLFYFTSPAAPQRKQVGVVLVTGENKWATDQLKAGLEQAAKELNVELLYQEIATNDVENQRQSLSEELADTVGVITYGLADPQKIVTDAAALIDLTQNEFTQQDAEQRTTDYQRGASLGEVLSAKGATTIVYWQSGQVADEQGRAQGLADNLATGQQLQAVRGDATQLLQVLQQDPLASLVLDGPQQLAAYTEAVTQSKQPLRKELFLLEFSDQILAAIDQEEVVGAVLQDDYSRGYQSLYQLVGTAADKQRRLPNDRIVTKDNLFSPLLEPLVFPYKE